MTGQDTPGRETWHVTRLGIPSTFETNCPCPKTACGAVDPEQAHPLCEQHPDRLARTMRGQHRAEKCPATPISPAS